MKTTKHPFPARLRKYAGMRYFIDDQHQRACQQAFTMGTECLAAPYTAFGRFARNGLLLNDKTADFLYTGKFGFISGKYKRGTYPLIESYVTSIIRNDMSSTEKVIALSQSLYYEVSKRFGKPPAFLYGENDEQTLLKGGGHCSCKARLLCAMCQMIGLQARPILMMPWYDREKDAAKMLGGHTTVEVLLDDHWGFFDPQRHLYCRTEDGAFPGVLEIRRNPELFTRMSQPELDRMEPLQYNGVTEIPQLEYYWHRYFHPKCPIQISRHDVTRAYEVRWTWATDEFRKKQETDFERNRAILGELADRGELTEEIYQLGLEDFRRCFGITDGGLHSQAV